MLTYMEPYRSLALLTGSLGLVTILIALSTDFWFVAVGPSFTFHSGLWPKGVYNKVAGKGEGSLVGGGGLPEGQAPKSHL